MKTVGEKVIIKPIEAEITTKSGIILDSGSIEKPNKGNVVATGIDCKTVKLNDIIHYPKYGTTEITYEGVKYIILQEKDIVIIE